MSRESKKAPLSGGKPQFPTESSNFQRKAQPSGGKAQFPAEIRRKTGVSGGKPNQSFRRKPEFPAERLSSRRKAPVSRNTGAVRAQVRAGV